MIRIILSIVVFALCVLSWSSHAVGQATRPAEVAAAPVVEEHPWPKVVEQLSKALAAGDREGVEALLQSRASIRRFGATALEDVSALMQRVAKASVVGQHGYLHPPLVMAADLAADFKNAAGVPDKDKVRYLIDDEADMKRANATAVQWVTEQLGARQGTPIGVIVLWTPRPVAAGTTGNAAATHDVLFVLCRGEEVSPKVYKLMHIICGNPLGSE